MDLHYLEIFNTVARYTSFKKASEILHISQPAISIQIKKLENQADLKLFYKTGNKIYLTENGYTLYEYTKKIFALIEEMESKIACRNDYIGGIINVGGSNTPGTYILPMVIGEMKKRYPTVTFNLHIANTSEIATLIENGTLDLAVNGGDCNYSSHVSVERLFSDKLVLVASPMSPLCEQSKVELVDLAGEGFIVHEKTSHLFTSYKLFIQDLKIHENISMYLGSIDAIKQAASANLGISLMPYFAVKTEIETCALKILDIGYEEGDYPYNLIYNKNKDISLTTQKFIEVLKEVCQQMDKRV